MYEKKIKKTPKFLHDIYPENARKIFSRFVFAGCRGQTPIVS